MVTFSNPSPGPLACTADGREKEVSVGLQWATAGGAGKRKCSLAQGWGLVRKSTGLNTKGGATATLNPIDGDCLRLRLSIIPEEADRAVARVAGGRCSAAGCDAGPGSSGGGQYERGKESVAAAAAAAGALAQALSVGAAPGAEIPPGGMPAC